MVNDVISSGSIEISEKESINYLEVVRQIKKWYPYMIEEIEYMEFEWVNDSTIFQYVMNGLKWSEYSLDGDVIEAYHEDWMEGCGGYYIRRV